VSDVVSVRPTTPAVAFASSAAEEHVLTIHWLARAVAGASLVAFIALNIVMIFHHVVFAGLVCVPAGVVALCSISATTWLRVSSDTVEVWTRWPACTRSLVGTCTRDPALRVISQGGGGFLSLPYKKVPLPGCVHAHRAAAALGVPLEVLTVDGRPVTVREDTDHDEIVKNRP
jgi:hypothetical protein